VPNVPWKAGLGLLAESLHRFSNLLPKMARVTRKSEPIECVNDKPLVVVQLLLADLKRLWCHSGSRHTHMERVVHRLYNCRSTVVQYSSTRICITGSTIRYLWLEHVVPNVRHVRRPVWIPAVPRTVIGSDPAEYGGNRGLIWNSNGVPIFVSSIQDCRSFELKFSSGWGCV
jgi:hypothetical protein